MSQSELKDLIAHLKELGVIQAIVVSGDVRIEMVFEQDPFSGLESPSHPTPGTDWS